jgi:hypothetical protein
MSSGSGPIPGCGTGLYYQRACVQTNSPKQTHIYCKSRSFYIPFRKFSRAFCEVRSWYFKITTIASHLSIASIYSTLSETIGSNHTRCNTGPNYRWQVASVTLKAVAEWRLPTASFNRFINLCSLDPPMEVVETSAHLTP